MSVHSCNVGSSVMPPAPDQKKLTLEYAEAARQFEIERFWQRSTFFWAFIGATFVAFGALYPSKSARLLTIISTFGGLSSLAWTLQNRGSKYWQEAWEQKIKAVENAALGVILFSNKEPCINKGFWGAEEFSVSKLAIMVSDLTVVIWIALLIAAMNIRHDMRDCRFGLAVLAIGVSTGFSMFKVARGDWAAGPNSAKP